MDKNTKLEYISNSFFAAGKIKGLLDASMQSNTRAEVKPAELTKAREMLQVITDYSPVRNKQYLHDSINKSSMLCTAYKGIKNYVRSSSNHRFTDRSLIETLGLVSPILGNRQRVYIDKLIKIYEILKT